MISDNLLSGGKERRFVELMRGLDKSSKFDCEVIVLESKENTYYDDIFKFKHNLHFLARKSRYDFTIFSSLIKLTKKFRPDVIHCWGSMSAVYILPIVSLIKTKLLYTISDAPPQIKYLSSLWWRTKLVFPFSSFIIANSKAGLFSYNVNPQKGIVIYNGFDFNRLEKSYSKETICSRYDINHSTVIGMVANFTNNKDFDIFISSAQEVLNSRKDILFLAIGDGPNLNRCKNSVQEKFRNNIKFLGRQKNVESIISIMDICVLLTNMDKHGEGISNSILEYMALGKPVIATDSGGTCEIVINDKTGFLVKNKDINDIVRRLNLLINDPLLVKRLGNNGEKRILEEFSIDSMIDKYSFFYNSIN